MVELLVPKNLKTVELLAVKFVQRAFFQNFRGAFAAANNFER